MNQALPYEDSWRNYQLREHSDGLSLRNIRGPAKGNSRCSRSRRRMIAGSPSGIRNDRTKRVQGATFAPVTTLRLRVESAQAAGRWHSSLYGRRPEPREFKQDVAPNCAALALRAALIGGGCGGGIARSFRRARQFARPPLPRRADLCP
jgi:hypothetical protein